MAVCGGLRRCGARQRRTGRRRGGWRRARAAAARSRLRGGDSTAAAADSGGEKAGERGEVVGELTVVQFEAEDGRERELGVEVEARRRTSMAAAAGVPDSAVVELQRARGGVETVDGKAAGLWAWRIEAGRRAWPLERRRRGLLASARCSEEGEGRNGTGQEPSRRSRG